MTKLHYILPMTAAMTAFILTGCGPEKRDRKGEYLPAEGAKGVPDWVTQGPAAFKDGREGKAFYGVGAVSGVNIYSLLRQASENQARVDVARIFDTYVESLAKSYARSVGDFDASEEEQLVQDATKAYTNVTVIGVQIGDHYYDEETKTMYSLAFLDLEVFKNAIPRATQLSEEFRQYINETADDAFEEIEPKGAK